jgi:uncharacterized protein
MKTDYRQLLPEVRVGALPRIAVVGSGIAGLGAAHRLMRRGFAVTLFEANGHLGGHSHTVDVALDGIRAPVDTGFLVYNKRTYPRLVRLFAELGVESAASDMSFSVRNDEDCIEWAGTSVAALFAQPRNAVRPAFWRMLREIARFNRAAAESLSGSSPAGNVTLGAYLARHGYSQAFRDWYLIPMGAAIWSSPRATIEDFPFASFARFCANHGLLQLSGRPQWLTVAGGSRAYVERIAGMLDDVRAGCPVTAVRRHAGGVRITFADRGRQAVEAFDDVVLASHAGQSLAMLADPGADESAVLREIRYQPNRVVLHTDSSLMPRSRRAWSAWNYLAAADPARERPVAVTYWINRLQPLPFATPVLVTLNPPFDPDPRTVLGEFEYEHPLHDSRAEAAQLELASIQGRRRTWFCGAWTGYGFHEDGLASGQSVADAIAARPAEQRTGRRATARNAAGLVPA